MYKLVRETPTHFEVQHPQHGVLKFAKGGIAEEHQESFRRLPKAEGYADGGQVETYIPPSQRLINMISDMNPDPNQADRRASAQESFRRQGQLASELPPSSGETSISSPIVPSVQPPPPEQYNIYGPPIGPQQPQQMPGIAAEYEKLLKQQIGAEQGAIASARRSQEKAGQMAIAAATQEAKAREPIIMQNQMRQHLINEDAKALFDQYQRDVDTLKKEISQGKIDPNRLWNDKTSASRAASILGILVSGISATPQTGGNPVVNMIERHIDRDIDAQKADMESRHNLLRELTASFGNQQAAIEHLRAGQEAYYKSALEGVANKFAGTKTGAMAQQALADFDKATINAKMQIAGTQAQLRFKLLQLKAQERIYSGQATDRDIATGIALGSVDSESVVKVDNGIAIARSPTGAKTINEDLPKLNEAIATVQALKEFGQAHAKEILIPGSPARQKYEALRTQVGVQVEMALAGRVTDVTFKQQKEAIGSPIQNYLSSDATSVTLNLLQGAKNNLINQNTYGRMGQQAPAPSHPAAQPSAPVAPRRLVTHPAYPGMVFDAATGKQVR